MFPNSTVNPSKILITVKKRLVILGNFNKQKIQTVHTACLFHSELTKFSETFHKIPLSGGTNYILNNIIFEINICVTIV